MEDSKEHQVANMETQNPEIPKQENVTEYYQSDLEHAKKLAMQQERQKINRTKNHFSNAKLCFLIALIMVASVLVPIIILLIISGGDFNEGTGKGAVWWLLLPIAPLFYIAPVAVVVASIIGLVNVVLGFVDKKKS